MGAEAWSYFVPYREDIEGALEDLKHPRDLGTYGKATWTRDELHERR